MTMYRHTNKGKGEWFVYDSKKKGYELLPGKSIVIDMIAPGLCDVTIEKIEEKKEPEPTPIRKVRNIR